MGLAKGMYMHCPWLKLLKKDGKDKRLVCWRRIPLDITMSPNFQFDETKCFPCILALIQEGSRNYWAVSHPLIEED